MEHNQSPSSLPRDTSTTDASLEEPSVRAPKGAAEARPTNVAVDTTPDKALHQLTLILRERLLPGESETEFETFRAAIFAELQPRDAIEVIWATDIVQYAWNGIRMGRLNVAHLSFRAFEELGTYYRFPDHDKMRQTWMQDLPADRAQVNDLMTRVGLSRETLIATAMCRHIDGVERMARIQTNETIRRDALFREFDRRRALVAAAESRMAEKNASAQEAPALEGRPSHGE